MAVPGTGHDEVGVRDCGERGDVAGLCRTWGVLVGSCLGGGFGGCGRWGEAVGMVNGVDGLLLVHGPEADVSVCAAVSSGLMREKGRDGNNAPVVAAGDKVFVVNHGYGVDAALLIPVYTVLVLFGLPGLTAGSSTTTEDELRFIDDLP